jgi:type IV secretory pathway VirB4 component
MVIGRISPKYGDRQDYPTELDQRFMDEIFEIGTKKETSISLCQIVYPLDPANENEALETARRNIKIANVIQENDDKFLHQHDVINDLAAEGIYEYQKQLYHGKTKLFHHVLLVAVQGITKKEVKRTIRQIETVCDSKIIKKEIPQHGMVETFLSMQPTPYVWGNLFKKSVTAELCAKTSLLRSPDPVLAMKGRMLGMNSRTGNPIHFDFEDPNITNANALEIGVSGSGKSVDLLKDNIRAYLDGDNVLHVVPKKDGITDHLRVCKALNGQLWKIGFNGQNLNLFQVFFDESTMDNSEDGYQTAYLAHFTML